MSSHAPFKTSVSTLVTQVFTWSRNVALWAWEMYLPSSVTKDDAGAHHGLITGATPKAAALQHFNAVKVEAASAQSAIWMLDIATDTNDVVAVARNIPLFGYDELRRIAKSPSHELIVIHLEQAITTASVSPTESNVKASVAIARALLELDLAEPERPVLRSPRFNHQDLPVTPQNYALHRLCMSLLALRDPAQSYFKDSERFGGDEDLPATNWDGGPVVSTLHALSLLLWRTEDPGKRKDYQWRALKLLRNPSLQVDAAVLSIAAWMLGASCVVSPFQRSHLLRLTADNAPTQIPTKL